MGEEPLENIDNITDNHYVANVDDLKEYLYRAAISPRSYEKLEITDYIANDYFNVSDVSSVTNSSGTVSLNDNQVVWNLNGINSGSEETLEIDINLNDELLGVGGVYPTNESLSVTYKINDTSITESSTLTPILSDNYLVTYEANEPDECTVSNMPDSKNVSVFDTVKIETDVIPVCEGYQFKQWEIITEDVTQVNADYFVMSEKNVTLRATWSKLNISKSMKGTVSKIYPLYKMIADSSIGLDTDVNFNSAPTTLNSGIYTMESTASDEYPVHYYRGVLDNNNLIFANFCWKIVRTTSTGGVKLVYNGEPSEDGSCLSDRENHIGYGTKISLDLSSDYYYGTDYTYDSVTSTFMLSGELEYTTWSETVGPTLIGKFTCKSSSKDGTCSTMYQVISYYNGTSAFVLPLNSTTHYSQIGVSKFNTAYNSPADVGYMYGVRYPRLDLSITAYIYFFSDYNTGATSNYYYGDSIIYDNGTYILQNAEQKTWSDNYSNLAGYYTCRTTSNTCTSVYYIGGTTDVYQKNIRLTDGETIEEQIMVLSQNVIDNEDGTYTLVDPITILKKDWVTNYKNYGGYYFCNDLVSTTCTYKYKAISLGHYSIGYDKTFGYIYGNDVEYDTETGLYRLIDTIKSEGYNTDHQTIATRYHYTCFNSSGECSEVKYIYDYSWSSPKFLTLTNGKNIEDVKNEMFINNNNSPSSDVKLQIDNWYKASINKYTDMLEDTIWCNDRTLYSGGLLGKDYDPKKEYTYFSPYERMYKTYKPSILCQKTSDCFTISDANGNGLLTYPVGLLTADEVMLAGGSNASNKTFYLYTGQELWSMSASTFGGGGNLGYANVTGINSIGYLSVPFVNNLNGVRPSVSLKPGTRSIDGDGSEENPFIVEEINTINLTYKANGGSFDAETTNTVTYEVNSFGNSKIVSGEYKEPTHELDYMEFAGWYTDPDCTSGNEFLFSDVTEDTIVYAKWNDTSIS